MSRESVSERGPSQYYNFDTIRLLAALGVLISHAFPITQGSDAGEPLYRLTGAVTIGSICVWVFFAISGFLITRSYVTSSRGSKPAQRFIVSRILRIVPALFIVLLLLTFFVGPLLTSGSVVDYFRDRQTWIFLFLNLSLATFRDGLPGVFLNNPFAGAVDGSLWTLRWEVRCYAIVFILGLVGALNFTVAAAAFFAALAASAYFGGEVSNLFLSFAVGALIYFRPELLRTRAASVIVVPLILCLPTRAGLVALPILISYLSVWIGVSAKMRLPRLAKYGDFSYGVYIYAFPVQQIAVLTMGLATVWYWNVLISTPITLALAALSWFLVERPALSLKRRRPSAEGQETGAAARTLGTVGGEEIARNPHSPIGNIVSSQSEG